MIGSADLYLSVVKSNAALTNLLSSFILFNLLISSFSFLEVIH